MRILHDVDEFRRIITVNDIVLVGFVGRDLTTRNYMVNLLQKLESRVGHLVDFILFDVDKASNATFKDDEGINTLPLIRLYFKGKNVLEQEDCFRDIEVDYYVLKVSMKSILQEHGIRLTFRLRT
ncbi:MAG: hypothetical protein QXY36_04185 [Sulfolobales archaeon]